MNERTSTSRPASPSQRVFRVLAFAFGAAGLFHAVAIFRPDVAEPVPTWWHVLFVAINLAIFFGLPRRPRGFLPFFALYTVQQLAEHATRGIEVWRHEHRLDWASLVSVVFVPFVLALLVKEARAGRGAARAIAAQGARG